ncbi:MAG: hypothetical protein PSX42_16135 [bacterium]|nr:hypothetical protein [bacterium]
MRIKRTGLKTIVGGIGRNERDTLLGLSLSPTYTEHLSIWD